MRIELPSIQQQQMLIFSEAAKQGVAQLQANLNAPRLSPQDRVDESLYPRTHLLRQREGWQPPDPAIVRAYFLHFQASFELYNTDAKLAVLLGLSRNRRIRAFKEGSTPVPYGVWRHFLILTGRVPQDIIPVLAFMG
ncbi:hypothetical protein [Pseudomonas fluorescens]|uniref:hypothetical protein n=1 Tax=Pseudomonas fluorescens TaxID=294 RepID=UPI001242E557|nr:hypothetical protein [Pseudomonas fluorescens]